MGRNWKRVVPRSTLEAIRLCKDYAVDTKNLSVERIADKMSISSDLLYKWLATGGMHTVKIPLYEEICGCTYISDHLAHSHGKLTVNIPTGRNMTQADMLAMHQGFSEAMGMLARFYEGRQDGQATLAALTAHMEVTAMHRANVLRYEHPELELGQ